MDRYIKTLNELGEVLEEDTGADEALQKWNRNYFKNARKRYLQELYMLEPFLNEGCRILEVGSAPYHLTYVLTRLGYDITGVDVAPERFQQFIDQYEIKRVKCDIENEQLPFEDNTFDLIIFNEVFEHMRIDPISTLRGMNRVLKSGGILMLSTPNLYSVQNLVRIMLGRGFDNPFDEFNKLHVIGHMGHVREYSVKQVRLFLENTGFKPFKVVMKSYNPLKGMWTPFNLVRSVFGKLHTFQILFSRKK